MSRLIFGGVLERWPRIRWCFSHAGGAFASIVARLDHGWRVMEEARAAIPEPPSHYARRVWVDTITHSPRALGLVLETFGRDRVVLGSDYPFALGTEDPVARAPRRRIFPPDVERLIVRDNALAFLGLTRAP